MWSTSACSLAILTFCFNVDVEDAIGVEFEAGSEDEEDEEDEEDDDDAEESSFGTTRELKMLEAALNPFFFFNLFPNSVAAS